MVAKQLLSWVQLNLKASIRATGLLFQGIPVYLSNHATIRTVDQHFITIVMPIFAVHRATGRVPMVLITIILLDTTSCSQIVNPLLRSFNGKISLWRTLDIRKRAVLI